MRRHAAPAAAGRERELAPARALGGAPGGDARSVLGRSRAERSARHWVEGERVDGDWVDGDWVDGDWVDGDWVDGERAVPDRTIGRALCGGGPGLEDSLGR